MVNDAFPKREYSLYLLCLPDIPWQADQVNERAPLPETHYTNYLKTASIF